MAMQLDNAMLLVDNARAPLGAFAWKALKQTGHMPGAGVVSFLGSTGNCPANPNCPWGLASSIACGCRCFPLTRPLPSSCPYLQ